ncbi:MAG TPA: hypothetical protein VFK31_02685, partial [Rhodanobacteraceae bacterium]|nr:hypothetical protein [Rhodanobacteraceae bacterium]
MARLGSIRHSDPFLFGRKLALVAIVLLVALVMLPNAVWLAHATDWPTLTAALVLPLGMLVVLFALLGRWLWLACLLLAPFALLAPLETY